ncbi:MAG: BNR-4 repeat-containing protein [Prolixibacteraceae bacterium]|nr:BNR-4 repeat-containing protein [Prolixibacteraceae bacterium]
MTFKGIFYLPLMILFINSHAGSANFMHFTGEDTVLLNNTRVKGYRGIWFELKQVYEFGDKYSGGLGTYTAKHVPLAIYAPEVKKTFFVYGGTTRAEERHLLCMIGEYDHRKGKVSQPVVVCDKTGVNDPHDNPSLLIDDKGYLWVFVSGRGSRRPGFKFRSVKPYTADSFIQITEEEMTYPQPWKTNSGFFHFFTKYTGIRQLYFERSYDGKQWSGDKLLAAIAGREGERSGHYQTSACFNGEKLATFFNRHPDGSADKRTDLYYVETDDMGDTWKNAQGAVLQIPLVDRDNPARVIDYESQGKNVYMKDMGFTDRGYPVCLYIRSNGHKPGPESGPYEWCVTQFDGKSWITSVVTESDHNYDMGSLFITGNDWKIAAPTVAGPQKWGVGGELQIWQSKDRGKTWKLERIVTENSEYNHSYIRRPIGYSEPFCFFWADGDPHNFSKSQLYFGDFKGNVWRLPYEMKRKYEKPVRIN